MYSCLWLSSLGSMVLIVFGKIYFVKYDYTQSLAVIHNAITPTLWALALCWIVFDCTRNSSGASEHKYFPKRKSFFLGLVNRFLSHHVFLVLSRLNYSIYLLHLCVISLIFSRQQTSEYIDNLKSVSTRASSVIGE